MSNIVASLMAIISADVTGLKKGLSQTKGELEKTGKDLTKTGNEFSIFSTKGIAAFAGVAGAAAVAAKGIYELAKTGAVVAQTEESFGTMAAAIGFDVKILDELRKASKGTVADMTLMSSTATLLAGTSDKLGQSLANAAPQLMEIAKAANKVNPTLGTTTFMYESIAKGIKRTSPLILDNLGIVVKVGDANKKYAEQIGKTVLELTAEEKSIALLNEVLLKGDNLIQQAGGSTDSATDAFERMSASTTNLKNNLAKGLYPEIVKVVDDINKLFEMDKAEFLSMGIEDVARNVKEVTQDMSKMGDAFRKSKDEIVSSAIALGDYTLWGNKVFQASGDMSEGIGSVVDEFLRMKSAADDVNKSLAGMKFDMLTEGIAGFGESLVQQTAMMLIYKRTMGEITEATFQSSMAKLDELRAMERLNEGVLNHTITQGEWLKIMKDNIVTLDEVNDAVGYTTGNMTELEKATGITAEQWEEYGKKSLASADIANGSLVETKTLIGNIDRNWAGVKASIDNVTSAAGIAAMAAESVNSAVAAIPTYKQIVIEVIYNTKGRPVGIGGADEYFERGGNIGLAAGGPVYAGGAYVVGEQGPEMFVPNTSGRIVPNNQIGGMGGMGGGDTYVIHNHSAAAAALTMAMVSQQKRLRLQRSMGG